MNLKTIALVCTLASLGALFSVRAGDTQSATPPADAAARRGALPEVQKLTPEELAKFKAASEATKKDPKVEAAYQKMNAALQEYRASLEASMIAADPSMESILKKIKEARESARARGGAPAQ